MASTPRSVRQAAVIPVRNGQVCVVTSSRGKRWVIPKGLIDPGKTAGEAALQEAWEEAGLAGLLSAEPVGSYLYEKYGTTCHVIVFVLLVQAVAEEWPERDLRQRDWLPAAEAIERMEEPDLRGLMRRALRLDDATLAITEPVAAG
jgi:8-oxo-dGTP pyrophosphatase MutT (NUDIX family)